MRKNHIRKIGSGVIAFLAVAVCGNLSAMTGIQSELSFSGGWRQDHLRSFTTNNIDTSTDLIKGSHLQIWQIGVQGWVSPCLSSCEPWLNNFFARGSAYWGWVNNGIFLHQTEPSSAGPVTFDRGDVSHGHSWDYTVGGGYMIGCGCGLKIGPTGGYSSSKLTFKAENVIGVIDTLNTSTAINPLAYYDENVLISSKWQGPWVGVDAVWENKGWDFYGSYEYHWTKFSGSYHSPSADLADNIHFSDRRTGKNGFGHTGYLGAHYRFCDGLFAGLGVKYQYFRARGHLTPTAIGGFPAVGGTADQVDSVTTTWSSVSVIADLGFAF